MIDLGSFMKCGEKYNLQEKISFTWEYFRLQTSKLMFNVHYLSRELRIEKLVAGLGGIMIMIKTRFEFHFPFHAGSALL